MPASSYAENGLINRRLDGILLEVVFGEIIALLSSHAAEARVIRWLLTSVCKYWFLLITLSPRLWTDIRFRRYTPVGQVTSDIRRAAGAPLALTIDAMPTKNVRLFGRVRGVRDEHDNAQFMRIVRRELLPVLPQVVSLTLQLSSQPAIWNALCRLRPQFDLVNVEEVHVVMPPARDGERRAISRTLVRFAPRLTLLSLYGLPAYPASRGYPALTALHLAAIWGSPAYQWRVLREVLAASPCLQLLVLETVICGGFDDNEPVTLPNLTRIVLDYSAAECVEVMRHIRAPTLRDLNIAAHVTSPFAALLSAAGHLLAAAQGLAIMSPEPSQEEFRRLLAATAHVVRLDLRRLEEGLTAGFLPNVEIIRTGDSATPQQARALLTSAGDGRKSENRKLVALRVGAETWRDCVEWSLARSGELCSRSVEASSGTAFLRTAHGREVALPEAP